MAGAIRDAERAGTPYDSRIQRGIPLIQHGRSLPSKEPRAPTHAPSNAAVDLGEQSRPVGWKVLFAAYDIHRCRTSACNAPICDRHEALRRRGQAPRRLRDTGTGLQSRMGKTITAGTNLRVGRFRPMAARQLGIADQHDVLRNVQSPLEGEYNQPAGCGDLRRHTVATCVGPRVRRPFKTCGEKRVHSDGITDGEAGTLDAVGTPWRTCGRSAKGQDSTRFPESGERKDSFGCRAACQIPNLL